MQNEEIKAHVGKEVWWTKGNCLADVVGYEAGWVTIRTDDEKEHKVRGKELVVMGEDEGATEDLGAATVEESNADPSEASSEDDSASEGEAADLGDEVFCPRCSHGVTVTRSENIRCRKCGWVFRVRLHPDRTKYVAGLGTTPSGRDTFDINDEVAEALRGANVDQALEITCKAVENCGYDLKKVLSGKVYKAYVAHGGTFCEFLSTRYDGRNNGMIRMNLGNLWRGVSKRCEILANTPEKPVKAKKEKKAKGKKAEAKA